MFKTWKDLVDFMGRLGYGDIPDVEIHLNEDELKAVLVVATRTRGPLSKFAEELLRSEGCLSFTVLKVQNGLPMSAIAPFEYRGKGANRSLKFN